MPAHRLLPRTTVDLGLHPDILWDRALDVRGWPAWLPGVSGVRASTHRLGPTTTGELCFLGLWLPFSVRRFVHLRGFSLRIAGIPGLSVWVDDSRLTVIGLPTTRDALFRALQEP